jgi:hypothetical protein
MPKLSWSAFIELHPAAHLVAGVLPEGEATPVTRQALKLMTRLIARLAPKGLNALTIDRQNPTPEIDCVFEREIDARRIADALGARIAGRYPGWASQRTFRVDAKARKAIAAALDGVER